MFEGETWTYPSPQMFYNALVRKGKVTPGGAEEQHVESMVAVHNNMNEVAWKKVIQWEETVNPSFSPAKLLKFQGRPSDLSPKAWLKHNVFQHPLPFDRHDWTVLRGDGSTARYVLDYYFDDTSKSGKESLLVDVRPALDSVPALWHRAFVMPYAQYVSKSSSFKPLPFLPSEHMKQQTAESTRVWENIQADVANTRKLARISASDSKGLEKNFDVSMKNCQELRVNLEACSTDDECARASIAWTVCMAKLVCPAEHSTLLKAYKTDNDETVQGALEDVSLCFNLKMKQHSELRKK